MNKLNDFKNCDKGHFYPKNQDVCPYCPKGNEDSDDKTKKISSTSDNSDPTSLLPTDDANKTIVFGQNGGTNTKKVKPQNFDPNKTFISGTKISDDDDDSDNKVVRRKLRGWLVTFDLKDMQHGVDFKLIEGRNTIGKSSSSDITIDDNEVSSDHALILCKKNKFMLNDKLSSNGTFLNGEDIEQKVKDLKDGDEIKVGHTTLLFKQAFR